MLGAGALIGAYVVVMLAGAAFAVTARRQQRALAVAASVGATAADLRRVILLQGSFLGITGGILGILLGIGGAALVMRLTDDGSSTRYWGFHVPWLVLAGILVFAALVGTASAALPAHTVARSDILAALRGARRPQKIRMSRPVWGTVIMLLGLVITALAAIAVVSVRAIDGDALAYDSPLRSLPPLGLVIGPIVAQVGIQFSGGWLLWLTSRLLLRFGLSARLASRDAAAHASRTVPAFAAIAATVFIAVFALGVTGMQRQDSVRSWSYAAPVGDLRVDVYPADDGALTSEQAAEGGRRAQDVATALGATEAGLVSTQLDPNRIGWDADGQPVELPDDLTFSMAVMPERELVDPESTPRLGAEPGRSDRRDRARRRVDRARRRALTRTGGGLPRRRGDRGGPEVGDRRFRRDRDLECAAGHRGRCAGQRLEASPRPAPGGDAGS